MRVLCMRWQIHQLCVFFFSKECIPNMSPDEWSVWIGFIGVFMFSFSFLLQPFMIIMSHTEWKLSPPPLTQSRIFPNTGDLLLFFFIFFVWNWTKSIFLRKRFSSPLRSRFLNKKIHRNLPTACRANPPRITHYPDIIVKILLNIRKLMLNSVVVEM